VARRQGDLLITHKGLSGPVIHNLARDARAGDTACLCFAPVDDENQFKAAWMAGMEESGRINLKAWMKRWNLTPALTLKLVERAGLSQADLLARIPKDKRLALLRLVTAYPLIVERVGGFDTAMVTCGGVPLDEVDPASMASRRVAGLSFAGEVLDLDGDSGGYDLQAAWSTGALAGDA